MNLFSTLIICLGCLKEVWSYPDVAGAGACGSRYPNHGFPPQEIVSPYQIIAHGRYVQTSETVKITINGTQGFRGFMIQAKNEREPTPFGKFHNSVGGVNMDCGTRLENTISHYESSLKNSTTVTWEPYRVDVEFVEFYATVVYNITTFWLDIKTPKIYILEGMSRKNPMYGKWKNDTQYRTFPKRRFTYRYRQGNQRAPGKNRYFNTQF